MAGQLPAVDWRFAQDLSLVDRIRGLPLTFTRTTGRTVVLPDGSNGTIGANEPAFIYRNGISLGLDVWDSRTNLFLNSSAPATQSITVTAAAHTLSFKGTGTITLSGASTAGPLVGTGANNRVPLVFTPSAGSLTLTLSGSITEPQLELGSTASPFIPTSGASIQRTADVCSTTDLSWFNPAGMLFYLEYATTTEGSRPFQVTNSDTSERIEARVQGGWRRAIARISGADILVDSDFTASVTTGTVQKHVVAFTSSQLFSVGPNGTGTIAISRAPIVNSSMFVGSFQGVGSFLNGPISRLTAFPLGPSFNRMARLVA